MEAGYVFNNAGMRLTVIEFCTVGSRNVGLFQRGSDGTFITARNTSKDRDGTYSWAWGHYFTDCKEALNDYAKRKSELLKYTDTD